MESEGRFLVSGAWVSSSSDRKWTFSLLDGSFVV